LCRLALFPSPPIIGRIFLARGFDSDTQAPIDPRGIQVSLLTLSAINEIGSGSMTVCSGDHISVACSFKFYDIDLMVAVYRDLLLPRTLRHVAGMTLNEDIAPSPLATSILSEMYYVASVQE